MSGLPFIEIAVSLILIYFLASVLVSSILELYKIATGQKSKHLEQELNAALGSDLSKKILEHPSVSGVGQKSGNRINKSNFVRAAMDNKEADEQKILQQSSASPLPNAENANSTESRNSNTPSDEDRASQWFDDFQKDASKSFKNKLRIPTLIISILVTVLINIDTIEIAKSLYEDPELRGKVTALQSDIDFNVLLDTTNTSQGDMAAVRQQLDKIEAVKEQFDALDSAGLPIGWKGCEELGLCEPAESKTLTLTFQANTQPANLPPIQKDSTSQSYVVTIPIAQPSENTIINKALSMTAGATRLDSTLPDGSLSSRYQVSIPFNSFTSAASSEPHDFIFQELSGPDAFFNAEKVSFPEQGVQNFGFEQIFISNPPKLTLSPKGLNLEFNLGSRQDRVEQASATLQSIEGDIYTFQVSVDLAPVGPGFGALVAANFSSISFMTLIGWFITIIALMMGAAFWYEILKKITGKA